MPPKSGLKNGTFIERLINLSGKTQCLLQIPAQIPITLSAITEVGPAQPLFVSSPLHILKLLVTCLKDFFHAKMNYLQLEFQGLTGPKILAPALLGFACLDQAFQTDGRTHTQTHRHRISGPAGP